MSSGVSFLVRVRLARAHDANPVIGESGMQARGLDLGHVAGYAIFVADRAGMPGVIACGLGPFFDVTRETA